MQTQLADPLVLPVLLGLSVLIPLSPLLPVPVEKQALLDPLPVRAVQRDKSVERVELLQLVWCG